MMQLLAGQDTGGGFDLIWILIPIICCVLLSMGQRGEKPREAGSESESFYTTQNIQDSFNSVDEEVTKWRIEYREKQEERGGITTSIKKILGDRTPSERFIEKEKIQPRLLSYLDSNGPIIFEFIEVEGGGTVVKASYSSALRVRVAKLKAGLPLKIPATPIGLKCPSCGKPVLKGFNLCPYCGSKLLTE